MKQTAVEWLEQRFNDPYNNKPFITKEYFKQAKEMEKEQIVDAFSDGYDLNNALVSYSAEQYYNETYGK